MVIKVKEYQEKLLEGVKKLIESKSFADFLRFSSKFRKYSFGNVLLIWTQRPNATRVAGMRSWNSLGRTVKKGEKGIMIFAPFLKKARKTVMSDENSAPDVTVESVEAAESAQGKEMQTLVGFKGVYIFDVSQTEGKPLPELEIGRPCMDIGDAEDLFKRILGASPVPVDYEEIIGDSNGYYMPKEKKIVLSDALTSEQRCKTLLHELAHHLSLEEIGEARIDRSREELIAEGAAYIVSAHFGLNSSGYSIPYIASWSRGDMKEVLSAGEKMRKISDRLIGLVEPSASIGGNSTTAAA
ncbi:MAG: ArdC-like ssDNA-binding domain-containing protein [Deltaproteobacteria bacterium]|nr:ArdC-like ssDNA-binding domain-containing protein [Deltaproteobacteria bacterium]